jgi:dihydroorotate dehydrogenase (NAD+) catalytic subunit
MADLSVDLCGLRMRNPTMLAAGILDETGRSVVEVARAGAGAIVTKSIGSEPRPGHPNPTVVELEVGLLNAMGLPNPGMREYATEMREAKGAEVPVIASIFGSSEDEFAALAAQAQDAGADGLELNLSCPHAKGLGAEIGSDPKRVESICRSCRDAVTVPVFAKLTPNTSSIAGLAEAAERGGADAIVAINTVRAMAISPEARMPILGNRVGGLSGAAVKPIGVRCVYEIFEVVEIPVIGVGGIADARDALEYIMAGARAVQIGTAVWTEGPGVFGSVCQGLSSYLEANGCSSVGEIVGVAHHGRT